MSVVEEIRIIRDDLNQFYNAYENFNRYLDWNEYYQKFGFQNELESSDEDLSDWEDEYWMDTSEDDERLIETDNCKRQIHEIKYEIKKKFKVGESCFNPIKIED